MNRAIFWGQTQSCHPPASIAGLTPEQRGKADEIKKKYDGKLIQNREEFIKFRNDLNDDLIRLTGKRQVNCRSR